MKKHPSILRACRITTQKFLYFAVFLAALLRGTYFAAPVSKYLARLNVYSHFLRILKFMTIWISFNCPWKISIWLATFFPWIIRYLPFAKQILNLQSQANIDKNNTRCNLEIMQHLYYFRLHSNRFQYIWRIQMQR